MSVIGLLFWGAFTGVFTAKNSHKAKKIEEQAIQQFGKGRDDIREYVISCKIYKEIKEKFWCACDIHRQKGETVSRSMDLAMEEIGLGGTRMVDYAKVRARLKMVSDGYIPTNIFAAGMTDKMRKEYNPHLRLECARTPSEIPKKEVVGRSVYCDI